MNMFIHQLLPYLLLLLGMLIGSFLNVVIHRLPLMMQAEWDDETRQEPVSIINLWWPPSHCPVCKANIKPWDNIPVLSWLLLKGKCRGCHHPIPFFYPLSEAIIGCCFFLLALFCSATHSWPWIGSIALFLCILYTLALIDIRTCLLPDSLVFMLLWSGLLASVLGIIPVSPRDAVIGAVMAWGLTAAMTKAYYWLRRKEGFGQGDIKLFAAVSVWLGYQAVPALLLLSALLGAGIYVFCWFYFCKILGESKNIFLAQGHYLPFGPAIALAAVILLYLQGA
ncbi:prepilin peptidase [Enterobacillus tribolii]|uniref:Prepilin leader peptidase/N-methyltransferase n=1 Tax=Enterobacillus tribolii TaxID=1487935 RepID=A0A370QRJ8_9GAMM|nr:A24 family peptidase [Enterobacillus tribolii]MBW7983619.1 prepilin peptidase [Enterobacillus tribolii]RDK91882.1 leader peptidase (prepilin peptidase)/N-methyltransferase [Enterobacillus tribolii]